MRGRAVVSDIKTRPFENNPNRLENLVQRFFIALRADGQMVISEFLSLVELDSTTTTSVSINWHYHPRITAKDSSLATKDYKHFSVALQGSGGVINKIPTIMTEQPTLM